MCILVPRSASQFLGSQYWLFVECDRLVDGVEKWGISMETFYSTQKDDCYTIQGILLIFKTFFICVKYGRKRNGHHFSGTLYSKCYRMWCYIYSKCTSSFSSGRNITVCLLAYCSSLANLRKKEWQSSYSAVCK